MSRKKSTYKINRRVDSSILTQRWVFFPFPAKAPIVGDFWTQGVLLASALTSFIHTSFYRRVYAPPGRRREERQEPGLGWLASTSCPGSASLVSKCFQGLSWGPCLSLSQGLQPSSLSTWVMCCTQETCGHPLAGQMWTVSTQSPRLSQEAVSFSQTSLCPRLKLDPRSGIKIAEQSLKLGSINHPYYQFVQTLCHCY